MGSLGGLGGCWKDFGGVLDGSGGVFEGSNKYLSAKGVGGHICFCNMLETVVFFLTICRRHMFSGLQFWSNFRGKLGSRLQK